MSIGSSQPFRPAGTVSVAAGTTSSSAVLPAGGDTALVINPTTSVAFVRFGADPSVTATTMDTPVLPNARLLLGINALITNVAVVLATGSGAVYVTRGDGSVV